MPDSSAKLVPYAPLGVLKPVDRDIWLADGPEIAFGPLKMPFPTRMTVVRLPDGGVWVHSPIEAGDALYAAVAGIGPVRHLVAPNSLHYWYVPDWKARFPEAEVHLAPGLAGAAKRMLPEGIVLGDVANEAWAGTIDQLVVAGGWFREVVFFHRRSRTLILVDLIENFEPRRIRSPFMRLLVRLGGVADPDGRTPRDMQWTFRRSRPELRRAVEKMIAWQPERVILAHGRWYERNGAQELRRAFRWVM